MQEVWLPEADVARHLGMEPGEVHSALGRYLELLGQESGAVPLAGCCYSGAAVVFLKGLLALEQEGATPEELRGWLAGHAPWSGLVAAPAAPAPAAGTPGPWETAVPDPADCAPDPADEVTVAERASLAAEAGGPGQAPWTGARAAAGTAGRSLLLMAGGALVVWLVLALALWP